MWGLRKRLVHSQLKRQKIPAKILLSENYKVKLQYQSPRKKIHIKKPYTNLPVNMY